MIKTQAHFAVEKIQYLSSNFKPKVGIVLGSGLSNFTSIIEDPISIPYDELPGFPKGTVHGQVANLILGHVNGVGVASLQGRAHGYEGPNDELVKTYVRALRLLGCEYFLATNASGSMREDVGPGELMLITDHINLQPTNPLVGPNMDEFGPRFYPLDKAYNPDLLDKLETIAQRKNIRLHKGVYVAVLGPNYETAAEIKAFRILGGDAVGMSTVPEVLVANHCGMKVAVIAIITNYATGLTNISHEHEKVVEMANSATGKLSILLKELIAELA